MTAPVLQVRGLVKAFGALVALDAVDLDVPAGGIFGVVGPNGAGKTTLFSVICGFLGPDRGEVRVAGHAVDLNHPPPAGTLAVLPQDARFARHLPVERQLAWYARLQGFDPAAARQEARRVLGLVGLADAARRKPDTLSHGMYKRVGIAQAFLGDPRVIILDEPTAGLDPHAAREIRGLLRAIRGDRTVIVSSHNLAEVEDLCHAVAILDGGRLVRVDAIGHLVGEAAQVAFRLVAPPDGALIAALEALPFVAGAAWDADADRLRVAFDPARRPPGEAARDLLGVLVDRGVPFLELQLGKSLEERFIEETRRRE